jgi:hypothetical protein
MNLFATYVPDLAQVMYAFEYPAIAPLWALTHFAPSTGEFALRLQRVVQFGAFG